MIDREILGSNIRALRQHLGDNQVQFAERFHSPQSYVSKWENKGVQPSGTPLAMMAELAGATVEEFTSQHWTPVDRKPIKSQERDEDEIEIQEWDIAYGMGGGTYLDLPVTGETYRFSRAWLRTFTDAPPNKVFLARGTGDSMFPTIHDSDLVIVDTSDHEVRMGDKVYAVVYGTTGYIKRIRPMADGSVKMLSDNQSVPPETAYDGELSIVGRVVAVVRKI